MLVLNNITRLQQQQQQQQLEQQKKISVAKAFDPNNNNGWFDGNRNEVLKNGNDMVLKGKFYAKFNQGIKPTVNLKIEQ